MPGSVASRYAAPAGPSRSNTRPGASKSTSSSAAPPGSRGTPGVAGPHGPPHFRRPCRAARGPVHYRIRRLPPSTPDPGDSVKHLLRPHCWARAALAAPAFAQTLSRQADQDRRAYSPWWRQRRDGAHRRAEAGRKTRQAGDRGQQGRWQRRIAAEHVARLPDGYTILLGYIATHGINPALQKLRYDPIKDFEPIALVAEAQRVLVFVNGAP